MPTPRLYRRRRGYGGIVVAVLLVLVVLAGGAWIDRSIYMPVKSFTGQIVPTPASTIRRTASVSRAASTTARPPAAVAVDLPPTTTPVPPPTPTPLPTLNGDKRLNVLLLGSDTDAKFRGSYITQIMIVATIDPVHHTIGLLSIPRDFWVPIPGHGIGKVQVAYQFGEADHPNGGGIALARQTIEDDFGIHIDYYAWIGLEGFIKVIDTAGGVDVDVIHPILDDAYPDDIQNGKTTTADIYAYRRLYIPAGPQHLDGATALQYVRSRHADLIGDFGRSQRQQQVLLKLRQKVEQPGTLLLLPRYLDDLNGYVRTDMSLSELFAFGNFIRQYGQRPLTQEVLMPPTYSSLGVSNDGQDIVIPDWPAVHGLVARLFASPNATAADESSASGTARVAVENGTTIGGLATSAVTYLRSLGYTVDPAGNADSTAYEETTVTVFNPEKAAAAQLIAPMFQGSVQMAPRGAQHGADDIVVTLGEQHGTFGGF